jgi:hypothetical protein
MVKLHSLKYKMINFFLMTTLSISTKTLKKKKKNVKKIIITINYFS